MPQPMAVSPRQRERLSADARREQIITSAVKLIAERGFWGLTLRDVALMCGITEAGVLHHYKSKPNLLIAVLEYRDETDFAALTEILGITRDELDADPIPVSLRQLCAGLVERNSKQPEIVRLYSVLNAESLNPSHPAYDYFQRREKIALSLFTRATTPGPNAAAQARQVLSAMDGLQLRWLRDLDHLDLVAEWNNLFDGLTRINADDGALSR